MSAILTDADLQELSGLKQGAAQAKFLRRAYGLNVPRRPDGRVRVTWDAINQARELLETKDEPEYLCDAIKAPPVQFKESSLGRWQAFQRSNELLNTELVAAQPKPTCTEIREASLKAERRRKEARAAIVRFHAAKRRVEKLRRTPSWADSKKIKAFYDAAVRLTRETGIEHHVDHVIPLQGRLVSGLHVENNLQVIPWRENIVKRNKFEVEI